MIHAVGRQNRLSYLRTCALFFSWRPVSAVAIRQVTHHRQHFIISLLYITHPILSRIIPSPTILITLFSNINRQSSS